MADSVIAARGLTRRFGKVVAIDGLDLDVPQGAALGLLGPSGAGKSTMVRLLAGLIRPSAGTLTIGGAPAGSIEAKRRLGVLLQDAQLYGWMTARETMAFAADVAGLEREAIAARIDAVAEPLSVEALQDRRVGTLSTPERGRLAIAQALIGAPEVLVLDEPFHRVDPETRSAVIGALSRMRGTTTIVLAAHRLADIEILCNRLAVLEAGRLVLDTAIPDHAHRSRGAFVIHTGGDSGPALLGLVERLRAEPWVVNAELTSGTLRVVASDEARAERELLPAVAGAGIPVTGMRREPQSIEGLIAGLRGS